MRTIPPIVPCALAVVALAAPVRADVDPVLTCLASKVKAAGRAAGAAIKCEAKAARTGAAVDPACLAAADQGVLKRYARAEKRGGCASDRGAAAVTLRVRQLATGVRPLLGAGSCGGEKGKLAASLARDLSGALSRAVQRGFGQGTGVLTAAVWSARGRFAEKVARLEAKPGCAGPATADRMGGAVESGLDNLGSVLRLVERQTVSLPSPVRPPNTPGSPGVTVTNPKLLAQFGGSAFSLNNVTYTRWRLNGPEIAPDAVLIAVPGFGGGAGNFEILAENLLPRLLEDHGLVAELWGYDRRTEQLEDRIGVEIASQSGSALIALDWFYGVELGLPLSPALAAGPNRRAVFYNTSNDVPFIANWTGLVFSRDIDVVVGAANAASGGNVFLAGHSAGTGFAARYAATDFNLTGVGPADPGWAKLRGLVVLEGGGGTTATTPLTADALDRIEAKFDGGLFGAVRDGAGRCVDGVTACTISTEAADCVGQVPPKCSPAAAAHGVILGISPKILASAEPTGIQGITDPDGGQAIVQADQGAPGNNAIAKVPELGLLALLPPGTVDALFGSFLDDDGVPASLSAALAVSVGGPGPVVGGLTTWLDPTERAGFPACPGAGCLEPDNGPAPMTLPGTVWGPEKEVVRIDRLRRSFAGVDGANSSDWYYPISGLGVTSAPGLCVAGVCAAGNVGAACASDANCAQSISLDSTALSVGRNRRDIENLTQAGGIAIPVLAVGGSNGLVPVPGRFVGLAQSIGPCAAASCGGTPRVVNAELPDMAFPTFGGVSGGFEVVIAEGFAHIDVVAAEDDADNPVVRALSDFLARNAQ